MKNLIISNQAKLQAIHKACLGTDAVNIIGAANYDVENDQFVVENVDEDVLDALLTLGLIDEDDVVEVDDEDDDDEYDDDEEEVEVNEVSRLNPKYAPPAHGAMRMDIFANADSTGDDVSGLYKTFVIEMPYVKSKDDVKVELDIETGDCVVSCNYNDLGDRETCIHVERVSGEVSRVLNIRKGDDGKPVHIKVTFDAEHRILKVRECAPDAPKPTVVVIAVGE